MEKEFYLLIPTYNAPRIQDREYILVLNKGEIRKPILITQRRDKFEKHLKYFKKFSWS